MNINVQYTVVICSMLLAATTTHLQAQPLADAEQQAIREAIDRASPAVVQLQIIGGTDRLDGVNLANGPSTGLILTADGYVVTSRYRFDPQPATVIALLEDGRQFASQIVATDFSRKLVLLKLVDAENLPVAEIAPAQSYQVGQWAIAVGRTYRVKRPNVSVGILSATRRIQGRALQTDAAVSPANYGGPLLDIQGRVLGIIAPMSPSSEKSIAGVEWYDSGIGFAPPLAEWQPALERLKRGEDLQLGYLGVELVDGSPRETQPGVKTISPAGPAEAAGLEPGDVIKAIDGQAVETQLQMQYETKPHYAGDTLEVTFERDGKQQTVTLTLTTITKLQESAESAEDKSQTESDAGKPAEGDDQPAESE